MTGVPAPAPADDIMTGVLAVYKLKMIGNIQSALQMADPALLTKMNAMQGTQSAISTGTALAAHINDPANEDETLQQLYSYMQTLFATAGVNFPNLNFNADGTLNLVVVPQDNVTAPAAGPAPAPASSGGRRRKATKRYNNKSKKSRKLNRRSK